MRFSARMHHSLLRTPIKKPTCILYVHNSIEIFFTLSPTKTILSYSQKRISTPFRSIGPSFKKSWNKNNKILEIIRFKKIYIYIYIYVFLTITTRVVRSNNSNQLLLLFPVVQRYHTTLDDEFDKCTCITWVYVYLARIPRSHETTLVKAAL